ncbi:MAG: hypothetical protein JOS17DRAFT_781629 [Linnemannia elongata]|nr:MAG: hypothetical protein JOS17DRAFT_781629 [Linnemannia elongata]
MTGQQQHPQQHRANKPSTGGFQLLPINSGDVDMLHGDGGDNITQATETPTNTAELTKELTEFSIDTGIQEFVIKESEYSVGRAVKDPVNSLLYDLTGQVTIIGKPSIRYLQVDSNKTERYLSVKLSDERSKAHLLALAYKNPATDNDGQATENTQEERPPARFTLYTDTMAAENRGRQVEINSLQPGTTKDKIKGAFTPLGEVEFVDIAHKRYGAMVAATVTFVTDRPVKELQEQGTRVMFVGNDSGRITRLGNEEIIFHKDLDRPAYSTILKQDNAQKTKGTQPNQMINMEEKISTIVATAVAEAMTSAMMNIRFETWVALKMLKEDMATETEGAKDETKRRKQPARGAAAAQQADEEQNRQTPQVQSVAESFERYNREFAQYMSHFGYHLGAHFRIVNCYVPASRNEEGKKEFQELAEWAKKEIQEAKEKGMETIVCGDFNGVVNPSLDRSNEKKQNTNIENGLLAWLVENQFTDSFRELHPETRAYSFHDISRLDMIWLAGSLKGGLTEAGMMPLEGGIHSDHKAVFAELDVRTLSCILHLNIK